MRHPRLACLAGRLLVRGGIFIFSHTNYAIIESLPDRLTVFRRRDTDGFAGIIADPDQAPGHTRVVHWCGVLVRSLARQVWSRDL